ncbi:DinI-like family protein [Yersinia massiliensis]
MLNRQDAIQAILQDTWESTDDWFQA